MLLLTVRTSRSLILWCLWVSVALIVIYFVDHKTITRAIERNCDLLTILPLAARRAHVAALPHLQQVGIEAQTLLPQLSRHTFLPPGPLPRDLLTLGRFVVLRSMQITLQALPLDPQAYLLDRQWLLLLSQQLQIRIVTHVGQVCRILLPRLGLLGICHPVFEGSRISLMQELVVILSQLSLRCQVSIFFTWPVGIELSIFCVAFPIPEVVLAFISRMAYFAMMF